MALIVNENSYISVTDADTYFTDSIYNSQWATYTDAQKAPALITATTYLDHSYDWKGYKTLSTQSLDWPRTEVYCCDNCGGVATSSRSSYTCDPLDSDVVPQAILDATCILALQLLVDNGLAITSNDPNIKKSVLDVMSVEYFESTKTQPVIPKAVQILIDDCLGVLKSANQRTMRA